MTSEQADIALKRRRLVLEHAWHLQKLGYAFDRFEPMTGVYVLAKTVRITTEQGVVGFSMLSPVISGNSSAAELCAD
jgi:hypothetical protein